MFLQETVLGRSSSKQGQVLSCLQYLHEVLGDLLLLRLVGDAGARLVRVLLQRHFAVGCRSWRHNGVSHSSNFAAAAHGCDCARFMLGCTSINHADGGVSGAFEGDGRRCHATRCRAAGPTVLSWTHPV